MTNQRKNSARLPSWRLQILLLLVASPMPSGAFLTAPTQLHKKVRSPQPGRGIVERRKRTLVRAGATLASSDSTPPAEEGPPPREKFRRAGMAAALFSTYFTVMGAKCALPSVLSLLTSKTGLSFAGFASKPQVLMAQQLTLSTMAVAAGKLLLGPVIDRFGGALCLQVSLSVLMILLAIIASCSHFLVFAVAWIFVDFIFSSCWAGCINAVHHSFPESEWAERIAMLAAAARTGNAASFALFGQVLQSTQSWRTVFWVSSFLQLIPISLLSFFGRKAPDLGNAVQRLKTAIPPKKASVAASLTTLRKEAKTLEFWLHLINRSALMVFGSFLLFVPTLMSQIYGLSNSQAAQVGSIFAVGCLLSVTGGARGYSRMRKRRKILASSVLMGIATLCSGLQLGHMKGLLDLSAAVSTGLMFLWGFCFAIPFYIPGSMYALARGGKDSSATIVDVFDFGGFGLLALFNGYVASIAHNQATAWIPTFKILTGCSLGSLVSLALVIFFD